jgi:tetratricopeptide (TPR) repeat protein
MRLNYLLFGLHPTGWHLTSVAAHLVVTLLVYFVLVAAGIGSAVRAFVTWVFASHPVHVQSVTWISGSPDLLMSAFLLGSYLCYFSFRNRPRGYKSAGARILYLLALMSKEVAITYPAIIFLTEVFGEPAGPLGSRASLRRALERSMPFVAAAVIFVIARYWILGAMRLLVPGAPGLGSVFLTIPSLLLFYVKQIVFPVSLGPIHNLQPVTGANLGVSNFFLPVLLAAGIGYLAARLSWRDSAFRLGLIWFLLPLSTALDTRIFGLNQTVSDRYLYLPLFGGLIVLASALVRGLEALMRYDSKKVQLASYVAALALAVALAVMTTRYNRVWTSDIALWEYGVRRAPSSPVAHIFLGEGYMRASRLSEARAAFSRALEIRPDSTSANVAMGMLASREGRYEEAEAYLKRVLEVYPDDYSALEQLGLAFQHQGKVSEAIELFDRGRVIMPYKRAVYTINIAVLYKTSNRPLEAQRELESLLPQLETAVAPDELIAWWYLGDLHREQGHTEQARNAYQKYLGRTQGMDDSKVIRLRGLASHALNNLRD